MKNFRAIAFERPGPVSDMFVARTVKISSVKKIPHRATSVVVATLLAMALPVFFLPGGTLSYFSDSESSTGNTFAAGPLDFTVTPDHTSAIIYLDQIGETFVITPASVGSSLPFRYKVSGAASGNAAFCAAIVASAGAPLPYAGSVIAFSTSDTSTLSPWSLTLSLPSPAVGVVDGQQCVLDLTFEAYQEGGAVGTEYHDTEHISLLLTADPPVIVPVIQTQSFANLDQPLSPPPSEPEATSTEPVAPEPTPPAPEDTPPPVDVPPPGDEAVTPPADTTPPPADTATDTPPADPTA